MNKFKFLVLLITLSAVLFQSCSSSDDSTVTQKSSALRIFLNEFKSSNNINGRSTNDDTMCFELVFPLTLAYNNGTTVTVLNQDELISILENETTDLYINGIEFPFDIIVDGSTNPVTIANETDFWEVIGNCDFEIYDDVIVEGPCYNFVYPFSLLTNNNQTVIISNEDALIDFVQDNNEDNYIVDFIYPFTVTYNNENLQINNAFEFEELNNNCVTSNCDCPDVVAPVCVETSEGIYEFPNACVAECNGFTSADFVDCNDDNNGSTDSLAETLDSCLNISYPVQVQYNGAVITANSDSELLQLYNPNQAILPSFNYPITISFEENPTITYTVATENGLIELMNLHCD